MVKNKIIAYLTTLSIILGITACTKNANKEENTILNDAFIVEVDNEFKIFKISEYDYHNDNHIHYIDLLTGVQYTSEEYVGKCFDELSFYKDLRLYDKLTNYMTEEEIFLLSKDKLTDEEIVEIINRAIMQVKEDHCFKLKKTL